MVTEGQSIERLVQAFMMFPGVGRRSAERMVYHLMGDPGHRIPSVVDALSAVAERVIRCPVCNNFTEGERCSICSDTRRDTSRICVVAEPRDLEAIEKTGVYRGVYHVLGGLLSPLDGIGPRELAIDSLLAQIGSRSIREILIALSSTVEGDATASFILDLLKSRRITVSRLARGVPAGGSLEYVDSRTLGQALEGRSVVSES